MAEEQKAAVSTREQFRTAADADRASRVQLVKLPSGLLALLVKPSPVEAFYILGQLPQRVAAVVAPGGVKRFNPEEQAEAARQTIAMARFVFFEPRVPDDLVPGAGILVSDVEWALRWAGGEVTETGSDLAAFRGEAPGRDVEAGQHRGDVEHPPKHHAGHS